MSAALEPLRETLLERVRHEREEALAEAELRAAAILAEAEQQGRALAERARAEGAAAATLAGSRACVDARRRSRELALAAQRDLFEELGRRAVEAVQALRDAPGYGALLERLASQARGQLGPETEVVADPAGGIRAHAGARSVDYTLPALAARCLEWLGADVERLWR